jgi:hypothetical protein
MDRFKHLSLSVRLLFFVKPTGIGVRLPEYDKCFIILGNAIVNCDQIEEHIKEENDEYSEWCVERNYVLIALSDLNDSKHRFNQ